MESGYVRILGLKRLSVAYKFLKDMATRDGTHHEAGKKEFCRLIKSATLLTAEEAGSSGLRERAFRVQGKGMTVSCGAKSEAGGPIFFRADETRPRGSKPSLAKAQG